MPSLLIHSLNWLIIKGYELIVSVAQLVLQYIRKTIYLFNNFHPHLFNKNI